VGHQAIALLDETALVRTYSVTTLDNIVKGQKYLGSEDDRLTEQMDLRAQWLDARFRTKPTHLQRDQID
jgi:hypothetical protein